MNMRCSWRFHLPVLLCRAVSMSTPLDVGGRGLEGKQGFLLSLVSVPVVFRFMCNRIVNNTKDPE